MTNFNARYDSGAISHTTPVTSGEPTGGAACTAGGTGGTAW